MTSIEEAKELEKQAEEEQKAAEEQAESKTMLAQFSINHASLDVQSRGMCKIDSFGLNIC